MLEEDFIIGLKVLAQVHAGNITYNCNICEEYQKEQLYCSGVSEIPVAIDEEMGEFYSCPIKWVSSSVYDWYDEYSYYQVFTGAAPQYTTVSSRFWEATKIYKAEYDKYAFKKDKPVDQEAKTDSSLAKFRTNFKSRK